MHCKHGYQWSTYNCDISHGLSQSVSQRSFPCHKVSRITIINLWQNLKVTCGKIHDYLGMVLYFSTNWGVRGTAPKHIQIILQIASTEMGGLSETPAYIHLLQVREGGNDLSNQQHYLYCMIVSKILFMVYL